MPEEQFATKYAVDPTNAYDASKLKGKSVVITGGASGLGEEMARQFVKAGAFVTIGDVSPEHASKVVSELGKENAAFSPCDVLKWSDQVNLFKTAIANSPSKRVDIVCANAGISGQDTVWQNDSQDNEPIEPNLNILQTNLTGVMYTAKLAMHYLSRNGEGNDRVLILTASLAGYLDQPGSPQYCASKWGVRGMMRSLRRTMPGIGMRVNLIAPWFIRTRIMSDEVQQRVEERGVVFAEKADAAGAVLHMAADSSINGKIPHTHNLTKVLNEAGRACAIVPRDIAPQGFMDLLKDDNAEDDIITNWQNMAMNASHRIGTK